jgi:hypothetical protein
VIKADHNAAARVNLTACSPVAAPAGGIGGGELGDAGEVLLMLPSLPHPGEKETDNAGKLVVAVQRRTVAVILTLVSAV